LPHGAFYVFPNITETGWPSKKLADALLDDAGVAALSGTAFGEFGEGYLRFSVANSIDNIEKPSIASALGEQKSLRNRSLLKVFLRSWFPQKLLCALGSTKCFEHTSDEPDEYVQSAALILSALAHQCGPRGFPPA